jgi:hypothetical protein
MSERTTKHDCTGDGCRACLDALDAPSGTTGPADAPEGACSQHQTPDANCRRCVAGPADAYTTTDALRECAQATWDWKERCSHMREDCVAALNQVLSILHDLDCPLDVRVTMAHDRAHESLRNMLAGPADAGSHETLTIARAAKFFRDFAEDTVLDVETLLFCAAWLENDPDAASASAPAAPRETQKTE